jgi:anti-anti-sigma factor
MSFEIEILNLSFINKEKIDYETIVFYITYPEKIDIETSRQLWVFLTTLITGGAKKIIVDLKKVTQIDSGGISTLISATKQIRKNKGDLVLTRVNESIVNILDVVRVGSFIKILNTDNKIVKDCLIEKFYIDTREIFYAQNAIFIALKGLRDGNQFILDAYQKGIRYFILNTVPENLPQDANFILVNDSLKALQALAQYHRSLFKIPVIGITGSNGKTLVKEWLTIFLSTQWTVCKSPKSYNSQIGVPLSVLELQQNHQLAIFEAGISQPHEMDILESIIQPTEGILTHMGDAHQEHFINYEQKLLEKLKLFKKAAQCYEKTIEINPEYKYFAYMNEKEGNYTVAINHYRKALDIDPSYKVVNYNIEYVYEKLGKYDEALASYKREIEINPKYAEAYNSVGIVQTLKKIMMKH